MKTLFLFLLSLISVTAFGQQSSRSINEKQSTQKWRVSVPIIILPQLVQDDWNERTHTQHIEIHIKRVLDEKNIIGIKLASWRLFQPMGILWWDGLLDSIDSGDEFYPGHARHTGIGISYQRMLWKGLFSTIEVLPQYQTYEDLNGKKVGSGFNLYNSLHIGYHIPIGKKKRFFIEPQIHSNFWIFDTNTPEEFDTLDDQWKNYFLFEPNIYIGINF